MAGINIYFPTDQEALFTRIADALDAEGYIALADALPVTLSEALYQRAIGLSGEFKRAGVGRGQAHAFDDSIRTDGIRWLNQDDPAEAAYLAWMEQLRQAVNRRLYLGLFDFESHFAVYEPGSYYRKHLDSFQGIPNRVLSTVYYLNPHWSPDYGGGLLIHAPGGNSRLTTVMPTLGTLAIFLSAVFPHEVAVTHCKRYSVAGWFRVRCQEPVVHGCD